MPPVLRTRNKEIEIDHGSLLPEVLNESYLDLDAAAGATTLTLPNIANFAVNQIVYIGELGEEDAEIVKSHASTPPSGTTVTLASALARSHANGTRVRVFPYDQFELSHAATATGSKTVLTVSGGNPPSALGSGLIAISPGDEIQAYKDTEHTTGFYFARYKNSISGGFSDYSDPLRVGGWAPNTVGYILDKALARLGLSLSDGLTWVYLVDDGINEALRLIKGKQIKWPEHSVFEYALGTIAYGLNRWELPSNIYDRTSKKSISSVRIANGERLIWLDPVEFDTKLVGQHKTEVRTEASAGDITLEVNDSSAFEDSGTLHVYVANVRYDVTYTSVTRSTTAGVFTGIPATGDGSIPVTVPVDAVVRQNDAPGVPGFYTVKDGYLEVAQIPDGNYIGRTVLLDYDCVADSVDSDGDTIDFERYDMVLEYTTWKAKMKARNDGTLDMNDGYYLAFRERLNDTIRTKQSGKKSRWAPNINRVNWNGPRR